MFHQENCGRCVHRKRHPKERAVEHWRQDNWRIETVLRKIYLKKKKNIDVKIYFPSIPSLWTAGVRGQRLVPFCFHQALSFGVDSPCSTWNAVYPRAVKFVRVHEFSEIAKHHKAPGSFTTMHGCMFCDRRDWKMKKEASHVRKRWWTGSFWRKLLSSEIYSTGRKDKSRGCINYTKLLKHIWNLVLDPGYLLLFVDRCWELEIGTETSTQTVDVSWIIKVAKKARRIAQEV